MKLSVLLLFTGIFQLVAANMEAQNAMIHISGKSLSVEQLIVEIEKQTDYLVVYSKREVDTKREITLPAQSGKVSDYLAKAFDDTDVHYELESNYIVLSKKEMRILGDVAQKRGRIITGIVKDDKGESIIGANVVEKGTTNGTVTDVDGKYSLEVSDGSILQFSYIGYLAKEEKVGNKSNLDTRWRN